MAYEYDLLDLTKRKEFQVYTDIENDDQFKSFGYPGEKINLFMPGLKLHGAQSFIRNFMNPNTHYERCIINWQTGTGKSIAAAAIAHEFMKQYRLRNSLGDTPPSVTVISFTARQTIQAELLRHPEFGFISKTEAEELQRIRLIAHANAQNSDEAKQYSNYVGILRRRITDRSRGGYYNFYGYKEFANRLFSNSENILQNSTEDFTDYINDLVKKGEITINVDVLNEIKNGLLICDEIHNTYNIAEKNNYGAAILYALDKLGDEAPRAVYMSATMMTGSAAEIVDLLNLVVPRKYLPNQQLLKRSTFFTKTTYRAHVNSLESRSDFEAKIEEEDDEQSNFTISQLKEGALELIGVLSTGRVSFLLDTDVGFYPRRDFIGESNPEVPYIKFVYCDMSPLHEKVVDEYKAASATSSQTVQKNSGFMPEAYTLYDMIFPSPVEEFTGLFRSSNVPQLLSNASEKWKTENGVIVEKNTTGSIYLFTGPFLELENIKKYSTKMYKVINDVIRDLPNSGKMMLYHHRVRMSGVLIYQEALKMNGFIDETGTPNGNTLCAICGIKKSEHTKSNTSNDDTTTSDTTSLSRYAAEVPRADKPHEYKPCRFVVAHSEVDKSTMARSIDKFNSANNIYGTEFKLIIGSRIIREGINFNSVRHQYITSLPTDFPTLIQVFGRVVRKNSHMNLPADQREVQIKVYVTSRPTHALSPELQKYIDKGREFTVIQEVEREIRKFAIDSSINYDKIYKATNNIPALELLPYQPLYKQPTTPFTTTTFDAYEYSDKEVSLISSIIRILFRNRSVWTYDDLYTAVISGTIKGISYNTKEITKDNFDLALNDVEKITDMAAIRKIGPYYIYIKYEPYTFQPVLDVETFIRNRTSAYTFSSKQTINLTSFIKQVKTDDVFKIKYQEFVKLYEKEDRLEFILVDYNEDFHYNILKSLITTQNKYSAFEEHLVELYTKFKIAFTKDMASGFKSFRNVKGSNSRLVGYVKKDLATFYDGSDWYSISLSDIKYSSRHRENDILVGYVTNSESIYAKLKLREPAHKIEARESDSRTLARGAVCETRSKDELLAYIRKIKGNIPEKTSAVNLCKIIKLVLLKMELQSRNKSMMDSIRWVYLFNDRTPTLASKIE